ncbi:MAG TPA: exo-alpha-sialidase [Candidatus Brocadiia bacterium]|nr:exo-alpha-sialidase [Candidatus Brocadiia bacterium]
MRNASLLGLASCLFLGAAAAEPFHQGQLIFDPDRDGRGHVHASCVVECPNGDIRACWYENGPALPPGYYAGDKDKSDDVRVGGSRLAKGGAAWDAPFVMADTFGVSDNNPCMCVDRQGRLWLVHATLLCVPVESWGSSLPQFHVSSDYANPGAPRWERESILVVRPNGFEKALMSPHEWRSQKGTLSEEDKQKALDGIRKQLADPYKCRLGWMPRAHPLVRSDGAILIPLANENFGISTMAITSDGGATWTISEAVPSLGIIQPTLAEFPDGRILAFFRNGHMLKRIARSESKDGGMTWAPITFTDLPHPGSGLEAMALKNGNLLMIYNDSESARDTLAVSISDDLGKTWKHTRHLEKTPGGRFDYPSIIQAKDGSLHATYTVSTKVIKHAHFNEEWVMKGD